MPPRTCLMTTNAGAPSIRYNTSLRTRRYQLANARREARSSVAQIKTSPSVSSKPKHPIHTTAMSISSSSQINNCERSAWGIAWSCLAVIIACAWKAVHLDVPNHESTSRQWWRRTRMTLWTLFVPEFVIRRAAIQWFQAQTITEDYKPSSSATNRPTQCKEWFQNLFHRMGERQSA